MDSARDLFAALRDAAMLLLCVAGAGAFGAALAGVNALDVLRGLL
jgi:H+/gluconate symporter-like permease